MVLVLRERNQTCIPSRSARSPSIGCLGFPKVPLCHLPRRTHYRRADLSPSEAVSAAWGSHRSNSCIRTLGSTEQQHHHKQRRGLSCKEKPAFQRVCCLKPSPSCFHLWETQGTSPWSADPRCYLGVLFSGPQDSFSRWADLAFSCPLWRNLGTSMTAHLLTAGSGWGLVLKAGLTLESFSSFQTYLRLDSPAAVQAHSRDPGPRGLRHRHPAPDRQGCRPGHPQRHRRTR